MNYESLKAYAKNKQVNPLIIEYLAIFALCILVSIGIERLLWIRNVAVTHTLFELICIFISLSTFIIIWFTYSFNHLYNHFIGSGFFAVAVFDIFHTYYWPGLNKFPRGYYGLSAWYWIMGRFVEAVIILLITFWIPNIKVNKWVGLSVSAAFSLGSSHFFVLYPELFPTLMTEKGVTPLKIGFEYVIVALFVISAFKISKGVKRDNSLTYRYILLSLLIAIPGELCFTLFTSITSFYNTLGHVFKVTYYYFLFKGIFLSVSVYPYEKLKDSKIELEKLNCRLEEVNAYYYELLNKLPLGFISCENDYKVKFANSTALELLGCTVDEVEGLTAQEIANTYHKQIRYSNEFDADKFLKSINSSNSKNPIKNTISTIINKQGKEIIIRVDAHRLENNDLIVLFNEASKEEELENLQLQTQTILNSISSMVAVMDRQNRIILCNKAFEKIYEVRAEEIIGMDRDDFNKLLNFSNLEVPHKVEYSEGKLHEVSVITPNSNKKNIVLMYAPVHNINGEKIGHISIGTDITKLKKDQQKILQQEKLAIIGQMGAGIVHETKNHLASIKGYCQLLSLKISDDQLKSYIDRIENIAADVNKVIVDFLSLAKPGEAAMDVVSINEIIESMKYMLESPSFMKGVDININLESFEKDIVADESQIKQVVLNMAKNAIEAMENIKKPRLDIITRYNYSRNEVQVVISDNGKGVSKKNLDKLGTPFFTTKNTGTGLGLSVCYKIIKEHGGNIEVKSQEDKGTTFVISLPCIEDCENEQIS